MNDLTPPTSDTKTRAPMDQTANQTTRARAFGLLAIVVVLGLLAYGVYAWVFAGAHEDTDDAYVAGNVVAVTARDPGTVIAIHADNTQSVHAGEALIDLDPSLVDANVAAAEAKLGTAVRDVRGGVTRVASADAGLAKAQTALAAATHDLARRQAAGGAVSGEEVAHAADAVRSADAALDLARSQRNEAAAAVAGTDLATNPAVLAAAAELTRAMIAQSHMHITAPVDGVVAQRAVQLGQQIAAGTPLMSVVPLSAVWVDANFRETQLAALRIGQPVTLTSDSYGKDVVFHGVVAGLNPGSGNAFALLPPQNASGNWIKIVQRLTVRIAINPDDLARHPLALGLSANVSVDTTTRAGTPVIAAPPAPAQTSATSDTARLNAKIHARIAAIIAANAGQ